MCCFRYPSGKPFHWQFAKELEIAVAGNIILDDVDAELEAVLMGAGIGYLLYEQIKEYLDTGRLECVLGDWSTERPASRFIIQTASICPAACAHFSIM